MPAAVIRRTGAVIRLWDRLGRCALDRTAGCGGTYYGRMTAAVIRRIVAVIRRTVAVIRLRDRLGRCAGDRTARCGWMYYGRMTAAGSGWPMLAAVIRRTVAVLHGDG